MRFPFLILSGTFLLVGCAKYQAQPLSSLGIEHDLRVEAAGLHHPLLPAHRLDLSQGLTPDDAAVIAVLINPSLRAARDGRQLAAAQVISAGILPNPELSYTTDFVTGGNTADTFTAYGAGLSWEVTSLLTRQAKINAARAAEGSVYLDIAWQEWQTAEAAKLAAYDLIALRQQRTIAGQIDRQLADNLALIHRATDAHDRTLLDLAAADTASREAHAVVLGLDQQVAHQRMQLLHAMGLPPDSTLHLRDNLVLDNPADLPSGGELLATLETRRLDLVALRKGYQSQEETLRAAILAQFPKISVGFNQASDTSNVHTLGLGVTVDIPIFDRNQGNIAQEKATRQKLYDEYLSRVFDAHSDIALAQTDLASLADQIADAQAALPALENLVRTYRNVYDHGDIDALTYYTAVTDLSQKRLDLLKLQQQWVENRVALELAAGVYLPSVAAAAATEPSTSPATEPNP